MYDKNNVYVSTRLDEDVQCDAVIIRQSRNFCNGLMFNRNQLHTCIETLQCISYV